MSADVWSDCMQQYLLISLLVSALNARLNLAMPLLITNACGFTIWPGIMPNAGQEVLEGGGFELAAGATLTVDAPPAWSGRIWARTGCSFGSGKCATGDCADGQLQCEGAGAQPPVTLAELTLASTTSSASGSSSMDFYDISLVDGFNLPLEIAPSMVATTSAASWTSTTAASSIYTCGVASCAANLVSACPSALQVVEGATDAVISCKSACLAFDAPQYCCSGAYASPATCSPSSYSEIFKSACPTAYSYAFDDPTSTFTCSKASHYQLTFCPSSSTASPSQESDANTVSSDGRTTHVTTCTLRMITLRDQISATIFCSLALLFRLLA